jgi:DNA-binding IclR family transcriptional regulator
VERALRVLDAFAEVGGDAGTNELARVTGINASTVSRILATFAAAGYVQHEPATGRYRIGPQVLKLSTHVLGGLDLRAAARPHLDALVEETGETATLSVPGDPDAVTIDFVLSRASVASVARVGRPSIAHATATGKVMLAFSGGEPPERPLTGYTERTITDSARLAEEVAAVRREGHAHASGEREPELNAVAVPVFGGPGHLVAILGVQGPGSRFRVRAQDAAVAALRSHALALSASLGYAEPRSGNGIADRAITEGEIE